MHLYNTASKLSGTLVQEKNPCTNCASLKTDLLNHDTKVSANTEPYFCTKQQKSRSKKNDRYEELGAYQIATPFGSAGIVTCSKIPAQIRPPKRWHWIRRRRRRVARERMCIRRRATTSSRSLAGCRARTLRPDPVPTTRPDPTNCSNANLHPATSYDVFSLSSHLRPDSTRPSPLLRARRNFAWETLLHFSS